MSRPKSEVTEDHARHTLEAMRRLLNDKLPAPDNVKGGAEVDDELRRENNSGHPQAYRELPHHTRKWIEGKSAKELEMLDEMLDSYATGRLALKIARWFAIMVGGLFASSFAAAKFGLDIWAMIRGGK
ncbi:hypothetical protein FF100_05010 [Methylobacterium terricola]|uniref:Uncharacterized protein n=1 Tax=Methylobacterium terricola TaxID=2583531 RepID=A0A5C4LKB1_9HYPH|nr:hypothetical protein [Methylobacterium terricola]TNC14937.1 hypothetical protein FF100_05010 [Methylobacterium terricola]